MTIIRYVWYRHMNRQQVPHLAKTKCWICIHYDKLHARINKYNNEIIHFVCEIFSVLHVLCINFYLATPFKAFWISAEVAAAYYASNGYITLIFKGVCALVYIATSWNGIAVIYSSYVFLTHDNWFIKTLC